MSPRRFALPAALLVAFVLAGSMFRLAGSAAAELPSTLTDQEFWRLTEDLSEPNGAFQSDNLMSNEHVFARIVPDLIARTKPGGVYLGVGPEQNFTYIAAMKPRMAFITDIRRGNLHLQLMYKALFELSADRAEFVSRLFTKKRPAGLTSATTASDLMTAYWDVFTGDEAAYQANLRAIDEQLTKTHAFPLPAEDLDGIAAVYRAFYWYGPMMGYSANVALSSATSPMNVMSYRMLMSQTDAGGQGLSYLGSEEKYATMKALESRNLIVPVVGNFSGPKALRAVGAYVKEHGATVSAFYLSNVESYLQRAGTWSAFCANVATFPLDERSLFIRPTQWVYFPSPSGATTVPNTVILNGTVVTGTASVGFVTMSGADSRADPLVPITAEVKACR